MICTPHQIFTTIIIILHELGLNRPILVIKSNSMRSEGHVARVGE
jgi:hypothetical protein